MAGAPVAPDNSKRACLLRLKKDLDDLDPNDPTYKVNIPDPAHIQHFTVTITPLKGLWKNGHYKFNFSIPDDWPIERPEVILMTKIWHPTLMDRRRLDSSLLHDSYSPALTIKTLINGLAFFFHEPNPDEWGNVEAGEQWRNDYEGFISTAEDYQQKYALD
jgi:ubiquitin-protein ligase